MNPKKGDSLKAYVPRQRRKGTIGRDWSLFYLDDYELSDADEAAIDSLGQNKKARTTVASDPACSRAEENILSISNNGKKKRRALQGFEAEVNDTPSGRISLRPKKKKQEMKTLIWSNKVCYFCVAIALKNALFSL